MKVGVIGVGRVGGDAALSMALRSSCRELVLIDANRQLAVSQALDNQETKRDVSGCWIPMFPYFARLFPRRLPQLPMRHCSLLRIRWTL